MAVKRTSWLSMISPCPSMAPDGSPIKSLCGMLDTPAGWVEPNRVIYDHELVLFEAGHYQLEVDSLWRIIAILVMMHEIDFK